MSVRREIRSRPGDAVAANCRRWVTALMALAVAGALSVAMIGPATTASAATAGWTLATTPTPGEAPLPATNSASHAPAANPTVEENGVSCTSSAFCVAVGDYLDSGGVAQRDGLIDTYSGGTWTATVAPEPATNSAGAGPGTDTNGHQVAHLESVSCASAGNCVAVGDYEDANGFVYGLIEVLSGGTWTATAAPEPATNGYGTAPGTDTNTKQQGALTSVTCVSATSCLAVGRYKDSDGNTFGLIETLASGAWTPTAAAEPTTDQVGAASGNTAGGAGVATLAAVECQSAVACLAVGKYNDADGNTIGLIEALASGSWSATAAPEPATNSLGTGPGYTSGGAGTASLADVTCAPTSGGVCIAVGRYTDTNAKTYGLVETVRLGSMDGDRRAGAFDQCRWGRSRKRHDRRLWRARLGGMPLGNVVCRGRGVQRHQRQDLRLDRHLCLRKLVGLRRPGPGDRRHRLRHTCQRRARLGRLRVGDELRGDRLVHRRHGPRLRLWPG